MSTGKVVLGVIVGATAGALLGVLFAPARGSYTRKKLSRTGENQVNGLKDKFNEFIDMIAENFTKVKSEVENTADETMTEAELLGKEVKDKVKDKFEKEVK